MTKGIVDPVLTDYEMPVMDGFALTAAFRSNADHAEDSLRILISSETRQ